jgi:perosamine synthetase
MNALAMLGGTRAVPRDRRVLPWPVVAEQDEAAVLRVLARGRFTAASAGEPEIEGLEHDWARRVGVRRAIAVSNGTAAITLALAALEVGPGDEVVLPALSFIGSALAPLHLLAVPVFADVDPRTFNLDPAALEAAITPRTKAIVVVHLHGLPADLEQITAIAERHGLPVVEDAAQAHGALYQGRAVGSVGAINAFSLNVSKNLATCGEGGLITTDDERLATRAMMLRQFGELLKSTGERSYVSHLLGWNNKPNAIQAAYTRSRLASFDQENKVRDENARHLLGRLAELPGLIAPEVPADRTHAWHILRFRVDPAAFGLGDALAGAVRAALMRALRAEGVALSHYQLMPLPAQRLFAERSGLGGYPWKLPGVPDRAYRGEDYPNTLRVIDDSFVIQKAHLHPDARPLLDAYADAFEKVWQHRDVIAAHAAAMPYRPPWEHAEDAARREWDEAFAQAGPAGDDLSAQDAA